MLEEITFSDDAKSVDLAEEYARRDGTSLEALIRDWLKAVASGDYFNRRVDLDGIDESPSGSE